jgi:hypothetical protein
MILEKNQKFQAEFQDFSERILKIDDEKIKKDLEDDLRSLLKEVKLIDQFHQDLLWQKNLSGSTGDSKNKILELRRKITKKLDGWEKNIKLSQNS